MLGTVEVEKIGDPGGGMIAEWTARAAELDAARVLATGRLGASTLEHPHNVPNNAIDLAARD